MGNFTTLFLIRGIIFGSVYALISLGFNVIYSTTGVINFAQGEFVMVSGIAASWAFLTLHWPFWLSLLGGVVAAGLVGVLLDVLAIRPVRKASAVTHIIITIGASIVIRSLVSLKFGTEPFALGPIKQGSTTINGANVDYHSLLTVALAAACMLLLTIFFRATAAGRAMKACAENPEAASLCGVKVGRMSTTAFGLSALLSGVAGIMITPILGSMNYDGGAWLGLKGFSAAIIGGLGNPVGGVIGGILIGVLEQFSASLTSVNKDMLSLGIVVIVLLVRPRGLLSR